MPSTSSTNLDPTTKLRHLPLKEANKLINIFNRNDSWKALAAVVTHPDDPAISLFDPEDISTLEQQYKNDSSPGEAMLLYWSTSGKIQPTLKDLIEFLKKAELLRAAVEVENDLMQDCNEEILENEDLGSNDESEEFSEVDIIAKALTEIDPGEMILFPYQDLQNATQNFSDGPFDQGGCKIGEGAYGCVYRAEISDIVVAVKKLRDPVDKQFITELKILTKFKHENLLMLLGCSLNGPNCCLVYEFMPNGSLQERLACVDGSPVLSWAVRCSIAYGSALGINHLHTYGDEPMVHRDIKSANILLDENLVPKVGDFGLVRMGSNNTSDTMFVTQNVIGTSIYMAREAFYGDVSIKLDSFSFGVVLLELLTGLPPYDTSREDRDLVTYMENCDNNEILYDTRIEWNPDAARQTYDIAKKCLSESKRTRPTIAEVLEDLKGCLSFVKE